MSGSLSASQMGALPGLKYPNTVDADDPRDIIPDIGVQQTGQSRQDWRGGETGASLRSGNLSTASRATSYAQPKGKIPLAASKTTLGSYLFAVDEGLTQVSTPEAAGTKFKREG